MIAALLLIAIGLCLGVMVGVLFVSMSTSGAVDDAYRAGYRAGSIGNVNHSIVATPDTSAVLQSLDDSVRRARRSR